MVLKEITSFPRNRMSTTNSGDCVVFLEKNPIGAFMLSMLDLLLWPRRSLSFASCVMVFLAVAMDLDKRR